MFGDHLHEVRRLMETYRYQGRQMHCRRSVAEHSWFVSKVAHGLAMWEKIKFHNEVDIEKVMFLAINHDIVESYTGDILSTTKQLSPMLRKGLEMAEEGIFHDHIVKTIPQSWGDYYVNLHEEMSKIESAEAKIVKAGDLIDRIFECMDEIERQNKNPFEDILIRDIKRLFGLNLMSANYFLKYSIKDIKADAYIPEDIKEALEAMDFSPYF